MWRRSTPLNSWESTYLTTSPGLPTPQQSSKRLRKNYLECNLLVTFYRSTIKSILAYCIWEWYSGCTARRNTSKCNQHGQKKSLAAHCPPWKTMPAPATLAGPKTSSRTHHTQAATCLLSCPLADGTGSQRQGPHTKKGQFFLYGYQNNKFRHALTCEISMCSQSLYYTASHLCHLSHLIHVYKTKMLLQHYSVEVLVLHNTALCSALNLF